MLGSEEWHRLRIGPCVNHACNLGQLPIRTGGTRGPWPLFVGELADAIEGVLALNVDRCTQCRRIESFNLDLSLPEL